MKDLDGEFEARQYELQRDGKVIGRLMVSCYGPYYLSDNDFRFLDSLNTILLAVGSLSLIGAALAGMVLARRLTAPIAKTAQITKEISEGNYGIRFVGRSRARELAGLTEAVNHMAGTLETHEGLRKRLTTDVAMSCAPLCPTSPPFWKT